MSQQNSTIDVAELKQQCLIGARILWRQLAWEMKAEQANRR